MTTWTFLTNYARVLVCVAREPEGRLRDIAEQVGLTERASQRIVGELCAAGYLSRQRAGRRNTYAVRTDLPLRHPVDQEHSVRDVLQAMIADSFEPASGQR